MSKEAGQYIPYATIDQYGKPYASFTYHAYMDAPKEDNFYDDVENFQQMEDHSDGPPLSKEDLELFRRRADEQEKYREQERLRAEEKEKMASGFIEAIEGEEVEILPEFCSMPEINQAIDDDVKEIEQNLKDPMEVAEYGNNIHTIDLDPVWGNMNNSDKAALEKMALEEVTKNMEISESDPNYNDVMCKKMVEFISNWVEKKRGEVQEELEKQKKLRGIETEEEL